MVNYLATGYSYDKYLKAYGCELEKGNFPYECMDDMLKLDDRVLPSQEAFYSRLKNVVRRGVRSMSGGVERKLNEDDA